MYFSKIAHRIKKFIFKAGMRLLRECYADLRAPQSTTWTNALAKAHQGKSISSKQSLSICFHTAYLGSGFAERQLVWLACELANRGHRVDVLCSTMGSTNHGYIKLLKDNNIQIHCPSRLPVPYYMQACKKALGSLQNLRIAPPHLRITTLSLLNFLLKNKYDILHCYLDSPNCAGGVAGLMAEIPIIRLSARSFSPAYYSWQKNDKLVNELSKCYKTMLKAHNCTLEANSSEGAKDYIKWLNLEANSIDVLHNGIMPSFLEEQTIKDLSASKPLTLICVQRMSHEKRPTLPLHILAQVKKEIPDARLIYIGTGELEADVIACMKSLHIEQSVDLLGTRSDVSKLLLLADIFILTSILEGFPNVIMEAMLAKLPIVATKVGGIPELVEEGKQGFLSPNPQEDTKESLELLATHMAANIIKLFNNKSLAKEFGKAGNKRILEEFSIKTLADKVENKYKQINE